MNRENIHSYVEEHEPNICQITARQCIKALTEVGEAKPPYIPRIVSALQRADLSKYGDSMRPLIEKDIAAAQETFRKAEKR